MGKRRSRRRSGGRGAQDRYNEWADTTRGQISTLKKSPAWYALKQMHIEVKPYEDEGPARGDDDYVEPLGAGRSRRHRRGRGRRRRHGSGLLSAIGDEMSKRWNDIKLVHNARKIMRSVPTAGSGRRRHKRRVGGGLQIVGLR